MAFLRAFSTLALGGLAAEAQTTYVGLSELRMLHWEPGKNCTGPPMGNQTLTNLPPGSCMNGFTLEGCLPAAGGPLVGITAGCTANCARCSGTTERVGPQSCIPDPSNFGAMMMFSSYTCVAAPPPGGNDGEDSDDPRDAQCSSYKDQWQATGCMTFFTQRCNGAELRFAHAACDEGHPCKASLDPSSAQRLEAGSCAKYCNLHGLQCVGAWFPGPNNESCDLRGALVRNASCDGAFSVGQGAPPTCECGGFTSTPTGPTALERSIASQCMSLLSGFYQCMESFRQSDLEYYNENLPPQGLKERVAWAMDTARTPRCTFIPSRLAQRLGAVPCPAASTTAAPP